MIDLSISSWSTLSEKRYFFYFFVPVQKKIEGFFRFIKGYVWLNLPPSLNFQKGKKARLEAITTFPLL